MSGTQSKFGPGPHFASKTKSHLGQGSNCSFWDLIALGSGTESECVCVCGCDNVHECILIQDQIAFGSGIKSWFDPGPNRIWVQDQVYLCVCECDNVYECVFIQGHAFGSRINLWFDPGPWVRDQVCICMCECDNVHECISIQDQIAFGSGINVMCV